MRPAHWWGQEARGVASNGANEKRQPCGGATPVKELYKCACRQLSIRRAADAKLHRWRNVRTAAQTDAALRLVFRRRRPAAASCRPAIP